MRFVTSHHAHIIYQAVTYEQGSNIQYSEAEITLNVVMFVSICNFSLVNDAFRQLAATCVIKIENFRVSNCAASVVIFAS
jgi:hypothetical protein